jgi:hypothetical protein
MITSVWGSKIETSFRKLVEDLRHPGKLARMRMVRDLRDKTELRSCAFRIGTLCFAVILGRFAKKHLVPACYFRREINQTSFPDEN